MESTTRTTKELRVTEGVSGLWHYHLSKPGQYVGLCGGSVMNCSLTLADWRLATNPAHFPKMPPTARPAKRRAALDRKPWQRMRPHPSCDLVLMLTKSEAKGLLACAGEGAEGLFNDRAAARDYIGGPSAIEAARRALDALGQATAT